LPHEAATLAKQEFGMKTFFSTGSPMFSQTAPTDTKMTSIGPTPGDKIVSMIRGHQDAGA
jgi:hypothetical protein